jgi:hypothetical protein
MHKRKFVAAGQGESLVTKLPAENSEKKRFNTRLQLFTF